MSTEDAHLNAQLAQAQSTEFVNAPTESSKTDNVSHHANQDGPTLTDHANNAPETVVNAQERPPLVPLARLDSC